MKAAGVPFLFAADADCPIGLNLSIDPRYGGALVSQVSYQNCGRYNAQMTKRALKPDITTVVLSSRWTNWRIGEPANPSEASVDLRLAGASSLANNREVFERGFVSLLDRLTGAGKKVVIVGPVPEPTYNVPHRLYVSGFGLAPEPEPADYSRRHRVILSFFKGLEGRKGVSMIWPAQLLCQNGVCPSQSKGLPVYFDHNHLTVNAAKSLAPLYSGL